MAKTKYCRFQNTADMWRYSSASAGDISTDPEQELLGIGNQ